MKEIDQALLSSSSSNPSSSSSSPVFNLELALFSSSPRCQLFHSIAKDLLASVADLQSPSLDWFVIHSSLRSSSASNDDSSKFDVKLVLSEEELVQLVKQIDSSSRASRFNRIFPFDHIRYASSTAANNGTSIPTVILHADLESKNFVVPHKLLTTASQQGLIHYVLRPFSSKAIHQSDSSPSPIQAHLQGYGVELALKNVEYRVLDPSTEASSGSSSSSSDMPIIPVDTTSSDVIEPHTYVVQELSAHHPYLAEELQSDLSKLFSSVEGEDISLASLDKQALNELGPKVMQEVAKCKDPLRFLQYLSQNLPSLAGIISKVPISEQTTQFLQDFGPLLDPMSIQSAMVVNGEAIQDLASLDPLSLLALFKRELLKYRQLSSLGLSHAQTKEFMMFDPVSLQQKDSGDFHQEPYATKKDFSPKFDLLWPDVINMVNDLETHPSFSRYPKTVRELLRPAWPGQILPVAKNFFTLLLVVDPSHSENAGEGVKFLEQVVRIILQGPIPIRIGFYIVTPNPAERELPASGEPSASHHHRYSDSYQAKVCSELNEEECNINFVWAKVLRVIYEDHTTFLTFLSLASKSPTSVNALQTAWESSGASNVMSWSEALKSNAGWLARQYSYLSSAGFVMNDDEDGESSGETSPSPSTSANNNAAFFNGQLLDIDPDEPLTALGMSLPSAKQWFQHHIYTGLVTDETDLYQFALEGREPSSNPSNDRYSSNDDSTQSIFPGFHPLIFTSKTSKSPPKFFNFFDAPANVNLHYSIAKQSHGFFKKVTHWIVSDFASSESRKVLKSWIDSLYSSPSSFFTSRLSIVPHSSSSLSTSQSSLVTQNPTFLAIEFGLSLIEHLSQVSLRSSYPSLSPSDASYQTIVSSSLDKASQQSLDFLNSLMNDLSGLTSPPDLDAVHGIVCAIDDGKYCDDFDAFLDKYTEEEWTSKLSLGNSIVSASSTSPPSKFTGVVIVTNGRMIALNKLRASAWDETSWDMLTRYEYHSRAQSLEGKVATMPLPYDSVANPLSVAHRRQNLAFRSDLLMKLISLVNSYSQEERSPLTLPTEMITKIYSGLVSTGDEEIEGKPKPMISVQLMLDPLSRNAQKLTSLLLMFIDVIPMEVELIMKPKVDGVDKLPLLNYYRYVASPRLSFDGVTGAILENGAVFERLPQDRVLTMNLEANGQWLVEIAECDDQDLDNILLSRAPSIQAGSSVTHLFNKHHPHLITAQFELESILLEGSCSDQSASGQPPRGLQLDLNQYPHNNSLHSHTHVDTLVMSNLGYFQLKANPGLWSLSLAHGRSSLVYKIDSMDFDSSGFISSAGGGSLWRRSQRSSANSLSSSSSKLSLSSLNDDENTDNTAGLLSISSFSSPKMMLKVSKQEGMEKEKLYPTASTASGKHGKKDDDDGLWSSLFGGKEGGKQKDKQNLDASSLVNEEDGKIHIFSVASGHLYERFLRIMMLSVKRTTKPDTKVKFWIIKNFLSPSFKKSIHGLAEDFGFEVELVQYQWPVWLRGQSEKQRKIWGYKILFLDVLFPLSLKKVIFVDADQVVRTDMMELMELDLEGAVYGFTPFCQGNLKRKETSGFRFWDSGFWIDHLHGRPYHISALFVVDLDRLRRSGAADQLRATYDNLSRDPNSLANLDQDLPNYLQHMVHIHSLPPNWLWCETWCTDDSKQQAKTIDLCNNPLTKTPKLENALRIIPEWPELDSLASQSISKFFSSSQTSSSSSSSSSSTSMPIASNHSGDSKEPRSTPSNSKDEL